MIGLFSITWLFLLYKFTWKGLHSHKGLEMIFYFDLYLNTGYAAHCIYYMYCSLINPFSPRPAKTVPFTLSNAIQFYSWKESLWVGKG